MTLAKTIAYWATTGLLTLAMGASGAAYLSGAMNEDIAALGYPPAFTSLMGVLKLLGAVGMIVPALPRVKEWVYAGFTFTFIGAAWSHLGAGHGVDHIAPPLVMLTVLAVSYFTRPANLWLGREAEAPAMGMARPVAAK
jgi:uncharacterized membrane protein YphA (DoxX/SURF4 family)